MQAGLWGGAAACVAVAVASGIGQWRRGRRRDLDDVGVVPWATVQFAAMMAALILASLALHS
ncbi:hypothetical protein [Sphingomonas sp.]|uniref:hypothetical protein n=1 Tax=Sphingomonas sp. TaxID=28214 RepID=UPI002B7FD38A|nr:hypothetical protein [Sphingomonas sp.]HWK35792.1 hypothetical protein [Sphingomonas sp.]